MLIRRYCSSQAPWGFQRPRVARLDAGVFDKDRPYNLYAATQQFTDRCRTAGHAMTKSEIIYNFKLIRSIKSTATFRAAPWELPIS
jgi:hypothetical protein